MDITISPLDSRYSSKLKNVKEYFSEYAFFRYRVKVEIEYFIELCKLGLKELDIENLKEKIEELVKIYINFSKDDYNNIKKIEKRINHDVKSIEYWLQGKFKEIN